MPTLKMKRILQTAAAFALGFVLASPMPAQPPAFICPEETSPAWHDYQMPFEIDADLRALSCIRDDGTFHGPYLRWAGDELWAIGHFSDGQLQGAQLQFGARQYPSNLGIWESGQSRAGAHWNDAGVRTYDQRWLGDNRTESTLLRDDGSPRTKIQFLGPDADGSATTWHANGRRKSSGTYAAGVRVGDWSCWSEDGKQYIASYGDDGVLADAGDRPPWTTDCLSTCRTTDNDDSRPDSHAQRCGSKLPAVSAR